MTTLAAIAATHQVLRGMARRAVAASGLAAAVFASSALACPVCAPSNTLTPAQVLINADRALLVRPEAGSGGVRVESVIKGSGAPGELLDLKVQRVDGARVQADRPILMVRDEMSRNWSVLGDVDASAAPLLRGFAQLKRSSDMSAADWQERVSRFVPLLEHPEPLVAEAAYGEVARAPYAAMRANRTALDATRLARWTEDPRLFSRRPLYLLLLGLAGGPADAQRIEQQLANRTPTADRSDLPALVAADIELRGPSRLSAIESHWLLNPNRSVADIQSVLVALSVHGNDAGTVTRERIIETYLSFIKARPPLGGLVAQDLAGWQVWDATPMYIASIDNPQAPIASRVAMANYLRVSPHPQARAAVEQATRIR
jgi:hypothetical protein